MLAHKLHEALASETVGLDLDGEVAMDGAYFGGNLRPENRMDDRKDRRLKANSRISAGSWSPSRSARAAP